MRKGPAPIKENAHDAGFVGAWVNPAENAPATAPGPTERASTPAMAPETPKKPGRPAGRRRHTHSVSLDDSAYERMMRACVAEGLEFSEFMEKAGLDLLKRLEEKRGGPYPLVSKPRSVLDDL